MYTSEKGGKYILQKKRKKESKKYIGKYEGRRKMYIGKRKYILEKKERKCKLQK